MIIELNVSYITKDNKPDKKFIKDIDKLAKENDLKLMGGGESGQGTKTRTYYKKDK
jgi:hypothetical protein